MVYALNKVDVACLAYIRRWRSRWGSNLCADICTARHLVTLSRFLWHETSNILEAKIQTVLLGAIQSGADLFDQCFGDDSSSTISPRHDDAAPSPTAQSSASETNLNEVAAPRPVYDPSEKPVQRKEYLENRNTEESQTNLNEVAAPHPVYDPSEKPVQRKEYLENRSTEDSESTVQELKTEPAQVDNNGVQASGASLGTKTESPAGHWLTKVARTTCIVGYLILFSFIGTLLRIAIECLTFYPGSPVNTSVIWANVGGSFIMGFLSEDQEIFRFEEVVAKIPEEERQDGTRRAAHLKAHKKTIPLYIGLTTGFCGSLTSFSTFIRDVYLALADRLPVPIGHYADISLFASAPAVARAPNGGFSFMALVAVLFTEIAFPSTGCAKY
ncbi:hypothetical protein CBS147353_10709 [Aspergillus niger]|nr:hypothetical protein CBS147353_10709 [Aspergillus niger]